MPPPNSSQGCSPSIFPHSGGVWVQVQPLPLASLNLGHLAQTHLPSPAQCRCQKPLPSPQSCPAAAAHQCTQPRLLLPTIKAQGPRGAQGHLSRGNRLLSPSEPTAAHRRSQPLVHCGGRENLTAAAWQGPGLSTPPLQHDFAPRLCPSPRAELFHHPRYSGTLNTEAA